MHRPSLSRMSGLALALFSLGAFSLAAPPIAYATDRSHSKSRPRRVIRKDKIPGNKLATKALNCKLGLRH